MPPRPTGGELELFPLEHYTVEKPPKFKDLGWHLWTEHKAKLIARYLREFVFVTRHGTYIDLFSGPQNDQIEDGWSADQVLKMQPTKFKLRHYHLFELDESKIPALTGLRNAHPDLAIEVVHGNTNEAIRTALPAGCLGGREATFCLIDQRTTECHWETCVYLSRLKSEGYKPELFYFFAQAWLNRALKSRTTDLSLEQTDAWWGGDGWKVLLTMDPLGRAQLLADRFTNELGYKHATPWPIRERGDDGRVMFFMIHATDHDRAPRLMERAYHWAVNPHYDPDDEIQLELELSSIKW